ncbi:MAG: bifunctional glutamate N-acetyltransferase/amino-acid acetyltransferase ArgJ [Candidatus Omnitrophica bacterium]|nr:bifunctional glutamate N-acetyltransferase/amino-acid acetyltransferase ArgJ [Candidatus Omnitrophota bacterium]
MIIVKGGVTAPKGFLASAIRAGIKKSGNPDLALLYCETPAVAAGIFTTNVFKASPVRLSITNLRNRTHRAIVVNSGNANCANGRQGDADALSMAGYIAKGMALGKKEVLVASTGIIGHRLPVRKIEMKVPELILSLTIKGSSDLAGAIMTTDTVKKEIAVKVKLGGKVVTIGGAAKGVGMIHPLMKKATKHATMIGFITTDVSISKKMLEAALSDAADESFNMISVDGDMSTNDSLFILANGLADNRSIRAKGKDYLVFLGALKFLCIAIAKMLAADGEGATKLVEINVIGAKTDRDARVIARKISTSNLLKCAIFGEDPNWGRVAASAGSAGVDFDPDKADIYMGPAKVLSGGSSMKTFDKEKVRKYIKGKKVFIKVDLGSGEGSGTAWTCDFSKEYVAINSEYST